MMQPDAPDVRREVFKEALLVRSQQGLQVGGPIYVALLAALAVVAPPLAAAWAVVGAGIGLAALFSGARRLLSNEKMARAVVDQVLHRYYAPSQVPPELAPYVNQSLEAAARLVVQAERARGTISHDALVELAETVTDLLMRMRAMCDQVVNAEMLLNSISDQFRALPRAAASAVEGDFNRNLHHLQRSIDSAREEIFQTAALLQQLSVQALLIQSGDLALVDSTFGTIRQTAADQSQLLQTRIQAMEEVAATTQAATAPLMAGSAR